MTDETAPKRDWKAFGVLMVKLAVYLAVLFAVGYGMFLVRRALPHHP